MPAEKPSAEVARLLAASGLSQVQAASHLTQVLGRPVKHYHVSRMTKGQRKVATEEMDALRALAEAGKSGAVDHDLPLTESGPRIPLFAAVAAGAELRLDEVNRVGTAPLHPSLGGARGAFAFVVPDDLLGERMRRGEIAHVLRNRPPLSGLPCLVVYRDGHAIARIYDRQDEVTLFVRQLQPKLETKIAMREVAGVHAITGVSFGPG